MRAGIEPLLAILLGQDPSAAPSEVMSEADWHDVLALAEEERVLAWTAARMRAQCNSMSPGLAGQVDHALREAALAAFYWSCELKALLHALAVRGIVAVPLKGPSLAQRIYGDEALRSCGDLDLLVEAAAVSEAEAVLAGVGFVPGDEDDYHRTWKRRKAIVELHYDVENPLAFDFDVAGALARTRPAEFHGEPCRVLAPEDELLFLCLHAVRHRYDHLSLVVDLRLAFEKLISSPDDWQPRTAVAELDGLLALGLAMVERLEPGFMPAIELSVSKGKADHLEKIADDLWTRILTKASEPADWRGLHAFFLELEEPGWARIGRRLKHMRILYRRVIDADVLFAARFGLHRPWQVRLLRPARLLLYAMKAGRDPR